MTDLLLCNLTIGKILPSTIGSKAAFSSMKDLDQSEMGLAQVQIDQEDLAQIGYEWVDNDQARLYLDSGGALVQRYGRS